MALRILAQLCKQCIQNHYNEKLDVEVLYVMGSCQMGVQVIIPPGISKRFKQYNC